MTEMLAPHLGDAVTETSAPHLGELFAPRSLRSVPNVAAERAVIATAPRLAAGLALTCLGTDMPRLASQTPSRSHCDRVRAAALALCGPPGATFEPLGHERRSTAQNVLRRLQVGQMTIGATCVECVVMRAI